MSQPPALPPSGGGSVCWNCQQPLQAGSARCLWCGVSQQAAPVAQTVVPTSVAVGVPQRIGVPPTAAPTLTAAAPPRQVVAPRPGMALGPAFDGTRAAAGARAASLVIDLVVVIVVGLVVTVLTRSALYGVIALIELVVGLVVLRARTGLTFGNALLRLRASRADRPFSPGLSVVGVVVVSVPRRRRTPMDAQAAGPQSAPIAYATNTLPEGVVLAAPQVISTVARPATVNELSESQAQTGAPAVGFASTPVPVIEPQIDPVTHKELPAILDSPDGTLLLIFDTGQREQFTTPVAINLGRNPSVTESGDKLVVVNDPESTVSKTHIRLEHSRGRTWVTDGGSTNGSELLSDDGDITVLVPGERVLVGEGDRVRIGNRAFTISLVIGGERA